MSPKLRVYHGFVDNLSSSFCSFQYFLIFFLKIHLLKKNIQKFFFFFFEKSFPCKNFFFAKHLFSRIIFLCKSFFFFLVENYTSKKDCKRLFF